MATVFDDRVLETTTTTGTGPLTLAGAVAGYQAWPAITSPNRAPYILLEIATGTGATAANPSGWEAGYCTVAAGVLTRATVTATSNGNTSPITLRAGTHLVMLALTADATAALEDVVSAATWGSITGTLSAQADLQAALDAKQAAGSYAAASHGHALSALTQSGATTGQVPTWDGSAWAPATLSGGGGGSGTVTSVGLTVPTGLSVSGSPVTAAGTLAVTFAAGYSIPATSSQTNWDTAYTDRLKWDGGSTGLTASTGRTSLGLGTAAVLNVPASGDAASGEVVKGSDTRLTDSRAPTSHTHPLSDLTQSSATTGQVPVWNGSGWAASSLLMSGAILGGGLVWNSSTSVSVLPFAAHIESTGLFLCSSSTLTLSSLSLSSSTKYYIYAYSNSGTPAIELSTTAPASPYSGTACSKTGDTSRRYLGMVLTDGSGNVRPFIHSTTSGDYLWRIPTSGGTTFTQVLTNGAATTATAVSCSGVVAPNTKTIKIRLTATTVSSWFSGGDDTPTTSTAYVAVGAGFTYFMPGFPLGASQDIKYINQGAGGSAQAIIYGFTLER